jgi:hypothetical protein
MSKRWRFVRIAIVCVAILTGVGWLTATRGGLGWFCPHTLEYQTQSEWTVLNGNVVIYRSQRRSTEYPFVDYLVREGYIAPVNCGECPRWHPMFHWNRSWRDGYALLHRALRGHESLIEWSERHPDCARILWPEGFRLLRSDDPIDREIGEYILYIGRRFDSVDELRAEIAVVKRGIRANAE